MVTQRIQFTVFEGKDIVSSIERFALENRFPYVTVHQAYGTVSELSVEGRGMIDAGNYAIPALSGHWSEHGFSGHRFLLNIHLID
ncbi:hypothetical protein Bca52824_087859 [Brassica carinata]|uniref:Uncharacterized protein n=1 Tax=Brassica carinata TaxID=52824 RepID=A0A8X7PAG5_BRACI|nr:hypothetical protein Bca52824_087859 [Brassica carinata]